MDPKLIEKVLKEGTDRAGYPTQKEVADFLAKYYPEEKTEDKLFHDNWGLFSKKPDGVVKRILLCTTPTQEMVRYCQENNYDLLVSHHDFLFHVPGVPQIIYHSSMDESARGHNAYFVRKMGLHNKRELHKVVVGGDLYKPLTLEEFKQHIIKRGFDINGMVWASPQADDKIESVLYCSGMGGMLLGPNHIIDISKVPADVYVTGELTSDPNRTSTQFKYIIELGHTSSEKPLFKWIKNMLRNRWQNLEIDLASKEMDIWGDDNYKTKLEKRAKSDAEYEERRQKYQSSDGYPPTTGPFDDRFNFGDEGDFGNDFGYDGNGGMFGSPENHPLIKRLMDEAFPSDIIEDVYFMLEDYYMYESPISKIQIIEIIENNDPELGAEIKGNDEFYFPNYE
jgi:putative NIF3 family GTP cyclohydrolase 1 type 2